MDVVWILAVVAFFALGEGMLALFQKLRAGD